MFSSILSIITVNLNNLEGLKKTMQSVFDQTFTDYEYIIIDGGSTDGSKEYIEQQGDKLASWVSEKDGGIYEAMNKGIKIAQGEYLLFLNSADVLFNSGSLSKTFKGNFVEDIVYCDVCDAKTGKEIHFPESLRFSFMKYATINHQGTFLKRQLFLDYGLYNESFKIISDWEFFMKCIFLFNCSTLHLPIVLTRFDFNNGLSTSIENLKLIENSREQVLKKYFSGFLEDYRDAARIDNAYKQRMSESLKLNPGIVSFVRKLYKKLT